MQSTLVGCKRVYFVIVLCLLLLFGIFLFTFIVDLPVRAVHRLEQTCVTGSAKNPGDLPCFSC